ncbi:MAG: hypothetical protein IKZ82_06025 [Clostridia bacterium]|nr:hypothetical protein [Clostridia bacterium]
MGQFSWLDCVDCSQIRDNWLRDVYVLVPKEFGGGHIKEECYNGYGDFGSGRPTNPDGSYTGTDFHTSDIYDLVVDWNRAYLEEYRKDRSFKCDWLQKRSSVEEAFATMEKREIGISIACYDEDNARLHYPIKITHDPTAVYEDCGPSLSDPDQGWYSGEDDEDEEVW